MSTETLICTRCQRDLPATPQVFKVDKRKSNGLASICKACAAGQTREWYKERIEVEPDFNAKRYARNPDEHRERSKKWYRVNKSRHRAYAKAYYEANLERMKALNHQRYLQNREEFNERSRLWRQMNNESYRAYNLKWFEENPERAKAIRKTIDTNRRARKRNLPNTFTPIEWETCLTYWQSCCAVCHNTSKLAADHWIPLKSSDSPGTVAQNMIPLCQHCNATKHARAPEKWLFEKLGYDEGKKKLGDIQAYFAFVRLKNGTTEE